MTKFAKQGMIRKKVKFAYITNDAIRKATFKKRKKGLLKKLNELSILCGIETSAIIYSPYESNPEAWPSPIAVQTTVERLRKMPETDQSKNMVTQVSFLKTRIKQAHVQLKKQHMENREKEIRQVMYKCLIGDGLLQNLGPTDLSDLGCLVDKSIMELN